MADLLPEDLLVAVLAHLSPRDLASSRRVCRSWRDAIDGHRLLRADLLPHSLGGIFLRVIDAWFAVLFARPSTTTGDLGDFFKAMDTPVFETDDIHDHCNGLLLLDDFVLNPATGRWASLPQPPPPAQLREFLYNMFLVFDPAVSQHYEVLLIPQPEFLSPFYYPLTPELRGSEWPPSPWVLRVFSSRTGLWEERPFVREGHGPPTDVQSQYNHSPWYPRNAFCRGRLYVQCQNGFVMRINTSAATYHLIKQPKGCEDENKNYPRYYHIGKSKDGVYCALLCHCRLQVWWLDESSDGQPEWVLRCDNNLRTMLSSRKSSRERGNGPWVLRYLPPPDDQDGYNENDQGKKLEWSSDVEDDDPESQDGAGVCNGGDVDERHRIMELSDQYIDFLGFHPYKEVVFFHHGFERGIAYHLSSSKIQDMGTLSLRQTTQSLEMPFPYTPCLMEVFPENN